MTAIATQSATRQEHATVVGREGERYHLQTASGMTGAKRAAGCLLAPSLGDTVLASVPEHGPAYVLCVLERDDAAAAAVDFPAGVRISAAGPVDIASAEAVNLAAPMVRAGGAEVEISADTISLAGRILNANASAIRFIAQRLDSLADRLFTRAKTSHRTVQGHDHARAGSMSVNAERTLTLHAEYSQVTAKQDARINAERVHIG